MSEIESSQRELPGSPADRSAPQRARTLDGLSVPREVSVASFDDVADVLRAARDAGDVVIPWGGGTMMGLGNLPTRADVALDVTALNQVVSYEPDDLTIAVQAGCRVGELSRFLAEHGQMLPFDAAIPDEATIGGLYCTAVSGPRRFGYGSMRDLVIGISVMAPDGTISRGGGMVVKNVSGYDMMRLHYGALGSLGVILQLNFKVLPAPRATRTVAVHAMTLAAALDIAMTVRESPLMPSAMVLLNAHGWSSTSTTRSPWTVLLRADGPEESVDRQAERMVEVVASHAVEQVVLAGERSDLAWQTVNQQLSAEPSETSIRVRIGVAPSGTEHIVDEIQSIAGRCSLASAVVADVGNGQVIATFESAGEDPSRLTAAWSAARCLGSHATLLTGPVAVKENTDVFGAEPAGLHLMQALKQQFDPSGVLNRGRFIGRL